MASLRVSLRQPPAWSTMRSTFPRPTVGRRNAKNAKQKILESLQTTFASFLHPLPVRLAIFTHAPNRKNSHQRHARRIVDSNCWLVESVVVNGCVQLCLELELGVTPRLSETINPVANLAAAVQKMTADYADSEDFRNPMKSQSLQIGATIFQEEVYSLSLGFRAAMQRSMSYKTLRLCDEQQRPKSSKNSRVRRGYSKFWVSGISGALGALPMAECEDLWWNWNAVASNLLKHLQMNSQEEQLVNYSYLFSFTDRPEYATPCKPGMDTHQRLLASNTHLAETRHQLLRTCTGCVTIPAISTLFTGCNSSFCVPILLVSANHNKQQSIGIIIIY